ncbi:MAG TPA: hypothetical protein VF507_00185, partial [Pyrinomonadaceae bacterium]
MKVSKAAQRLWRRLDYGLGEARRSRGGHSSLGEERVLRRYVEELLTPGHSRTVVDIGAGDGVRWSNTFALFRDGWQGLAVESDPHRFARLAKNYKYYERAYACRCRVTPDNVVPLLEAYSVG